MTRFFESAESRRAYCLDQAQRLLEVAISCTPTSDIRNELTDINIALLALMQKITEQRND
jgi:hypothetical protein